MAAFPLLNGSEIEATLDEQERIMLTLASGRLNLEEFTGWLMQDVRTTVGSEGV
jgi:prophage maintenance system killer protein